MVPNALLQYLFDNVHQFCQEALRYILVLHSPNRRWELIRKNGQYDVLDSPAILFCIDGL